MRKKKTKFIVLPNLLKKLRESREMSQTHLAKILGYSCSQFISNIERGSATLPPKKFRQAGRVLKVDPSFFVSAACRDFKSIIEKEI